MTNIADEQVEAESTTTKGATRRDLLKGAVAAGVGAAVYASPVVSSVPAYATHGLSTWTVQSGLLCFWFSPNHQSSYGDWHMGNNITNVYDATFSGTDFTDHANARSDVTVRVRYKVPPTAAGAWRELQVTGHPNNWGGPDNTGGLKYPGWNGGGMGLRLLDPTCEVLIVGFNDGKETTNNELGDDCITGFDTETYKGKHPDEGGVEVERALAPWNVGSSLVPVNPWPGPPIPQGYGTNVNAPLGNVPNPWQGDPDRWVYYHTGVNRKGPVPNITFRIRCKSNVA